MVSEREREELGKLTHQKLRPVSQVQEEMSGGRITQQNIRVMKDSEEKANSGEAKTKVFLARLCLSLTTGIGSMFSTGDRRKVDPCKEYGHNLPFGTQWKGPYPKCLDCGAQITDLSQLRGSINKEESAKFKSV